MSIKYVHTNIISKDWRELADFYQKVFGCEPVPPKRSQSGEWLERGTGVEGAKLEGMHLRLPGHGKDGPTLEIYQYAKLVDEPPPVPNRVGLRHLAFLVDDVEAILERVTADGGRALGEISTAEVPGKGQVEFVYAADPDGNIIELQRWF
jgi:catechol 2,3-dioxygenase-like lactoylglutathione lyase family enzyme